MYIMSCVYIYILIKYFCDCMTHNTSQLSTCGHADIPVEALIVDDLDSSLDEPVAESRDDDMESVGSEPAEQQKAAVVVATPSQSSSEMDEEANKKGYGKAYAAFGGGREGLEACAASKQACQCCMT